MAAETTAADISFSDMLYLQKETPAKDLPLHADDLRLRIERQVHSRLLPSLDDVTSWTRDQLVEGFGELHHSARGLAIQFEKFWERILSAHIDLRAESEEQEKLLGKKAAYRPLVQLLQKARHNYAIPRSPLCGSLVVQGTAAMADALVRYKQSISEDLSGHILQCLAAGAGQAVIGASKWLDRSTCCLSWYRSVVMICEKSKNESLTTRLQGELGASAIRVPPPRLVTTRTTTRSGQFDYRLAQYEHELFDAEALSTLPCDRPIPNRCRKVWEQAPDYLLPELRLVVGKILRERIIEVDLESEDWTHREEVDVVAISVTWDPAITLGPYVLTGWTPAEEKDLAPQPAPSSPPESAPEVSTNRAPSFWRQLFQ